jgi:dTDP-4-amino-4,6-dideoxygalactose transaminase
MSLKIRQSKCKKELNSAYSIVDLFERTIAKYAGSKYGVAVESCCSAIFLSLLYDKPFMASIPRFTYPGVACSVINSGVSLCIRYGIDNWSGAYRIRGTRVIDSALRFKRGMYKNGTLYCLSFHAKKHLPIGRGGMILTDDKLAYEWLKKARFDGRSEKPLNKDNIEMVGWNMYLTPEQAARGLMLFDLIKNKDLKDIDWRTQGYPDLGKVEAYK